jgi:glycopeptide antibiotics resistance protein
MLDEKPFISPPRNGIAVSVATTAASFFYISTICYLSFISAGSLGDLYRKTGIDGDDILHVLSFVVLGFVVYSAFSSHIYKKFVKFPRAWSVIVSAILAVVIELVQVNMPTRHASFFDLSLHASGTFIFYFAAAVLGKKRAKTAGYHNRKEVGLTLD